MRDGPVEIRIVSDCFSWKLNKTVNNRKETEQ